MRGERILNEMKPTHANVARFGFGLNMIGFFSCIGNNAPSIKGKYVFYLDLLMLSTADKIDICTSGTTAKRISKKQPPADAISLKI